jgi:hypothetical protein
MTDNDKSLIDSKLNVINIGVKTFYDSLKQQNVETIHVDWRPPADGDIDLLELIEKLT